MTFVIAPGGSRVGLAGTELNIGNSPRARTEAPEVLAQFIARARSEKDPSPVSGVVEPAVRAENLLQAQENRQGPKAQGELTDAEQQQVRELKRTDAEVRRHERAHANAGGEYAGIPHYQYTRGPDGQMYAVSGSVSIDTSPEEEPEATIRKMEVVIRAALAPTDPSPDDLQIAAKARQQKMEAIAEKRAEEIDEQQGGSEAAVAAGAYGRNADLVARTIASQASLAQALVA